MVEPLDARLCLGSVQCSASIHPSRTFAMSDQSAPRHGPPSLGQSVPLVTPLFQSSVYTLPDLDALDRIMNAEEPGFIYARDAHPNAKRLGQLLAEVEGARWGLVTSSGMAAITALVVA